MSKIRMFGLSMLVGLLLMASRLTAVQAPSNELTDRYLTAYRAYQQAIEQKREVPEIMARLDEYLAAKAAFDQKFDKPDTAPADSASSLPASTIPFSSVVNTSAVFSPLEVPLASFPAEIRPILHRLRRSNSPAVTTAIQKQLQGFFQGKLTEPALSLVKIELGDALIRQGIDPSGARKLFAEVIAKSPSDSLQAWAKRGLALLQAGQQHSQWQALLSQNSGQVEKKYDRYKKTSWLAFPVKIGRFFSYLGSENKFKKTQYNFQDFQLKFEELAAPFVRSVETVFHQFQSHKGSQDDSSMVRLLYSNNEAWFARWELLNQARRSIDIQYFIVEKDVFGMSFLGLLLRKAREGVRIRFMVDARGAVKLSTMLLGRDFLQELAGFPNVEVKVYNSIDSSLLSMFADVRRVISSNHDKIIVVDEEFSIVGGRNIANEYLVDKEDEPEAWRDCDVIIKSPDVACELALAFTEEFEHHKAYLVTKDIVNLVKRDQQLDAVWQTMDMFLRSGRLYQPSAANSSVSKFLQTHNKELASYPHLKRFSQFDLMQGAILCPVKIIDNSSLTGARNDITEQMVRFIDGSRHEIIIQNPYIVLTPRAEAALNRANNRGVQILVHTNSPQTSDSFPTEAVMFADWKGILQKFKRCRIFAQVGKGQLHAKNFVFDSRVGIVGTYNMDYVSEQINSEVVAVMQSADFASTLRKEILTDMLGSSKEYLLATENSPEFGPGNVNGAKNMWLIKTLSVMGFLRPLF